MSSVVALISDTHIGGLVSLSLHEWQCDTGEVHEDGTPIMQTYTATLAQDWIYQCWADYWSYVEKLCGRKHRLIVIHAGDIIEGNHHHTVQAMPNVGDQVGMAIELFKPIANLCSRTKGTLWFIRGTEAHAGEGAQSEAGIAASLGCKCGPGDGTGHLPPHLWQPRLLWTLRLTGRQDHNQPMCSADTTIFVMILV